MIRVILLLPVLIVITMIIIFAIKLDETSRYGSTSITSNMIDREVPVFDLPALFPDQTHLTQHDFKGSVTLLNIFSSWCLPCRAEHAMLMDLSDKKQLVILGLNWKDNQEDAQAWITELGNPYHKIGSDITGTIGIAFGITGVPETFLVNKEGKIIYHFPGPLTEDILYKQILPLTQRLTE